MENDKNETVFNKDDEGVLKVNKVYQGTAFFKKGTGFTVINAVGEYLTVMYDTSTELFLVEREDVEKVVKVLA